MEMVTWKIGTVATEINAFFLGASIDITWFSHTEESYCPVLIATSIAHCLFEGNAHILGDSSSQPFTLTR